MSDETKMPLPKSLQEIVGSLLFASETPLTASELRESVRAVDAEEGETAELMDVYRTCTSKEIDEARLRWLAADSASSARAAPTVCRQSRAAAATFARC